MHSSKRDRGNNNGDKGDEKEKDFKRTNTSSQKKQDSREKDTYCVPCKKTIPSGYMCGCEVKSFCEKNPHLFGKK